MRDVRAQHFASRQCDVKSLSHACCALQFPADYCLSLRHDKILVVNQASVEATPSCLFLCLQDHKVTESGRQQLLDSEDVVFRYFSECQEVNLDDLQQQPNYYSGCLAF